MVVDDEPANVLLLERTLKKVGYTAVSSTTSSARALELFRKTQPDLVLLDVHMPEVSGLELLERLRAEIPSDVYLPVLVMTADVQPEVKLNALKSGAKDFLTRPLDLREVLLRVRTLLEARFLFLNQEGARATSALEGHSVPVADLSQSDRLETGLVYFRCRSCGGDHPAPIQVSDPRMLRRTHLSTNIFVCPVRDLSARYSIEHLFWKALG